MNKLPPYLESPSASSPPWQPLGPTWPPCPGQGDTDDGQSYQGFALSLYYQSSQGFTLFLYPCCICSSYLRFSFCASACWCRAYIFSFLTPRRTFFPVILANLSPRSTFWHLLIQYQLRINSLINSNDDCNNNRNIQTTIFPIATTLCPIAGASSC